LPKIFELFQLLLVLSLGVLLDVEELPRVAQVIAEQKRAVDAGGNIDTMMDTTSQIACKLLVQYDASMLWFESFTLRHFLHKSGYISSYAHVS
jgi:hypothetical protein